MAREGVARGGGVWLAGLLPSPVPPSLAPLLLLLLLLLRCGVVCVWRLLPALSSAPCTENCLLCTLKEFFLGPPWYRYQVSWAVPPRYRCRVGWTSLAPPRCRIGWDTLAPPRCRVGWDTLAPPRCRVGWDRPPPVPRSAHLRQSPLLLTPDAQTSRLPATCHHGDGIYGNGG